MLGANCCTLVGNVGAVIFTQTNTKKDPICTFMLCAETEENFTTWVKVSAYGKRALFCKDRLKKGDYVYVEGELVNRESRYSPYPDLEFKITRRLLILNNHKNTIPADTLEQLKIQAEKEDDSVSNIVRRAVELYVDNWKK